MGFPGHLSEGSGARVVGALAWSGQETRQERRSACEEPERVKGAPPGLRRRLARFLATGEAMSLQKLQSLGRKARTSPPTRRQSTVGWADPMSLLFTGLLPHLLQPARFFAPRFRLNSRVRAPLSKVRLFLPMILVAVDWNQ